jgi:hypothetical protein
LQKTDGEINKRSPDVGFSRASAEMVRILFIAFIKACNSVQWGEGESWARRYGSSVMRGRTNRQTHANVLTLPYLNLSPNPPLFAEEALPAGLSPVDEPR